MTVIEIVKNNPHLTGFDLFYECYPRKKALGDAEKAWKQMQKEMPPIEEMLGTIGRNLSTGEWSRARAQFIPYPASWLRAKGWADE